MYIFIIVAPFIVFLIGILFGRFLGKSFSYLAAIAILTSAVLSIYILVSSNVEDTFDVVKELTLFTWIRLDALDVSWALSFNNVTCSMLVVVSVISSAVYIFFY